jgi:hypothetical protein
MRHLYNMVMVSQEGEVVAIYVNLAYPVCSFGALSETIRKSQTRSPEDQTEASGMLLPVLISQCPLLYMCVFRLCPHSDQVCLSFSTHPSVVKPKSVIRLLRANKVVFLSSVSSLLSYDGTPLLPQSGKTSVQK